MPHRSLAADGVRSGAASAGGNVRRRQVSLADTLADLSDRLDILLRDVSIGARSQRQFELQVEEAEAIATGLRGAFRSPSHSRPGPSLSPTVRQDNAPLWQGHGKAIW